MTYSVSSLIAMLKDNLKNDNGMTNADAEYQTDIDRVLNLHVNPQLHTAITINGDTFQGTPVMEGILFALLSIHSEIYILDRRLEGMVSIAVSGITPAGSINMREIPSQMNDIRRKNLLKDWETLRCLYLYGDITGQVLTLDIANFAQQTGRYLPDVE